MASALTAPSSPGLQSPPCHLRVHLRYVQDQASGSVSPWPSHPPGRGCAVPYARFPCSLGRAWPPWAHQAALVSGNIRFSTLSCHGHPQAASAAAWLNNSSSLLYSSLPGCEWLSKPHHSLPGPAALAFTPSLTGPPESCPRTGPRAWAMNYSGLL